MQVKWLVKWCSLSFYTDRHIKRTGLLYSSHSLSYHHGTPQKLTGSSASHATTMAGGILTMPCICWLCCAIREVLAWPHSWVLWGHLLAPGPNLGLQHWVFTSEKITWYAVLALLLPEGVLEVQLTARHSGNPLPPLPGYCLLAVVMPQTRSSQRSQEYFVIALEWQKNLGIF